MFGNTAAQCNTKNHAIPALKPGGGSIMLCGGCSAAGAGRLVMVQSVMQQEGKPETELFLLEEDINIKHQDRLAKE